MIKCPNVTGPASHARAQNTVELPTLHGTSQHDQTGRRSAARTYLRNHKKKHRKPQPPNKNKSKVKPSLLVQGQGWGPTLQPLIPSRLCARSALKSARESIALLTRVNPRLAAQCRAVSPVKGLRLFNAVASIWRRTLCPLKTS